jgi:class 3 adenylate cyclase
MPGMNAPGERSERSILLERKVVLSETLDGLIEQCRSARMPLEQALRLLMPRTIELVRAKGMLIRTFDEQLERRAFRWGEFPREFDAMVVERFESEPFPDLVHVGGDATLVLSRLDCAEIVVGIAAYHYPHGIGERALATAKDECHTASEMIDNYLEGIAAAARKQKLSVEASGALRSHVLEEGADRSVELLSNALGLEEVALIFADNDARAGLGSGVPPQYRLYKKGLVVGDSVDRPDPRLEAALRRAGERVLEPENRDVAEALGVAECVETALINGLVDAAPVGKLVVRNAVGSLDPEGMDVLRIFAECLSQRLVDYNRERRHLARHFAPTVVTALVREPDYTRKYLLPRVEPVAMLFSDMASFTAISEQVLGDAAKIGELIDTWAAEAVKILYDHGGVFDKLVGDCVIGLFGPPFFKSSPAERIAAAVRAGVDIAAMTRRLGREKGYDAAIQAQGIGQGLAATAGVNFGPTSVGLFGPNQDYTGFSNHMNNTARLQGVAKWNEVLVMGAAAEIAADALKEVGLRLLGPDQAKVKNVKDPISFFRVAGKEA